MPGFGQKGRKSLFLPKTPLFGVLGVFLAPSGLPGPASGRGFYINPSRRGPVPGSGGFSWRHAAQARG